MQNPSPKIYVCVSITLVKSAGSGIIVWAELSANHFFLVYGKYSIQWKYVMGPLTH